MTPPFDRTTCACDSCKSCCERPAYMIPGDWERIQAHLGLEDASHLFERGKGAVVGRMTEVGLVTWRIETIRPRVANGACIFLDAEKRCTIHEVSPFGCRYMDVHMSAAEGQERSAWGLRLIMATPEYKKRWETCRPNADSPSA